MDKFMKDSPMFTVKTVTTKPEGTAWYTHDAAVLGPTKLIDWVHAQPGFVSNKTRKAGKNKRVNRMVFADQASAEAFLAALPSNPLHQAKEAYYTANGFTKVTKKFLEVE